MTGFTTMTNSKNPKEYSRQYVDEDAERSDGGGVCASSRVFYDRQYHTPVHDRLSEIHDKNFWEMTLM